MAVYQKSNGIWYVQFYMHGTTHIKSSKSTNKEDAEALEHEMKEALNGNVKNEICLHHAIDMYVASTKNNSTYKNNVAIGNWTKENAHNTLLSNWHTAKFEKLLQLKSDENVSNGTLYQYTNFYRQLLKYCRKFKWKVEDVEFPKYEIKNKRLRYLSDKEEKILLDTLREHKDEYDLVILLLDTGARLNEILTLSWNHIDLDNRTISLYRHKVSNESILYMTNRVYDILSNRTELFNNMNLTLLRNVLNELFDDVTIHTLRHTLASKLIQNDVSLYEVKEILGHKNINTTIRYAHLDSKKTMQKVANILDTIN